ncbi:MAG: NAD(P)/FAD-dependent oxidoreductase, partial [Desulfuromonadales bacterium]|nr:NAD(P)/FAD-dependent oxidoreductase [Desulfuromonadales bacterium]NIR33032.1 NAD(P)/FAD-dependent oxidoreductase [Desulfuromonadales bacterium]NIS39275.1 NAD(P)/FAD-dependent oxidoreductase [Desulfuromonadales bacterium]
MSVTHDIVILGSGTTAFAGALQAASEGAKVLMVEQSHLGGTCVNWGCIPSKTLIDKAQDCFAARRGPTFGLNLEAGLPDCRRLMEVKREAVATLRREHYQEVLDSEPNIRILRGHGRFISPRELRVGAQTLTTERFLLACGGYPRTLDIPGLAEVNYLTSYSAMHLPCFPESLLIIGGGVIALEMGQMFSRFGTRVTILERGQRLLKEFDTRLTDLFGEILAGENIDLIFEADTRRVLRDDDGVILETVVGGEERILRAERLMLAVGTAPATEDIGLEEAGVDTDAGGFIKVDRHMRTSTEGIWAAGDVTGPPLIAPAGAREAEVAVRNMLHPEAAREVDHRNTPMGVFVDPEFASIGITGDAAREQGIDVVETFLDLSEVAKAHVMG